MDKKNILLVSGHPAQIHNLYPLKVELEKKGYRVFWLATDKDISKYLLDYYNIDYSLLTRPGKGFFGKAKALIINNWNTFKFLKKNNIDFIVSRVSPFITIGAYLRNCKHIGMSDTETSGIYDRIFTKFLSSFLTSNSFQRTLLKDQIRFNGNIELFYLHPNRFTPSKEIYKFLGIKEDQDFMILRFVSWDAYHDKGLKGFSNANKIKAVREFSKFCKVFITAENELPVELESYRIQIPMELMHQALFHAKLFFGESATMASESAVLGTPAIYLNKNWLGYTDEEESYKLLYSFKEGEMHQLEAINKAISLLKNPSLEKETAIAHAQFMENKIDVTSFLLWFIEDYPKSKKIMIENSNYQLKFQ